MKHIKIDCHHVCDNVLKAIISTLHVSSANQLINIFAKSLNSISYNSMGANLSMFNLYAPTWKGLLDHNYDPFQI